MDYKVGLLKRFFRSIVYPHPFLAISICCVEYSTFEYLLFVCESAREREREGKLKKNDMKRGREN